ncbi:MAG: hypothetical protein M1170_03040 [Patescibacteria group bacterium]|nr:hypothetical protein [Patescibacteria group bacterium]
MENQNQNNQISVEKLKSPEVEQVRYGANKFWRFAMIFCAVIVGILVLYVAGVWGWQKYRYWQDMKKSRAYEEGIKKWQQEDYAAAMADTYGGKTPQETLQMYIEAVEKGDYELASKYFIGDRQEEWKNELNKIAEVNKIDIFLKPLLESKNIEAQYSENMDTASIYGVVLISFKKYPNGIWKIIEI